MNGSKAVVVVVSLMVAPGVFVPHQLFVALTVQSTLLRLLPAAAVLPASLLNCTVRLAPPLKFPAEIAPPFPVAVLPVRVTLESTAVSVPKTLCQSPPPLPPAVLLLMSEFVSISKFEVFQIPPPSPAAWFLEIVLP